jgi:hypothetical protein
MTISAKTVRGGCLGYDPALGRPPQPALESNKPQQRLPTGAEKLHILLNR